MNTVQALTEEYDMLPRGGLILCAVSGGADSMCLLHLLKGLAEEGGFTLSTAHFNHHLRGDESDRDESFVVRWCKEQGIACTVGHGDVRAWAEQEGKGVEETARTLRYRFLRETAKNLGACRIATAHNADDNVETLLLHLVRGSGLQGLTGIPPRREELVRPLLTTGRAEIEAYLAEHGVPHVEDSTNADEAYRRNRIRAQVMPVLREMNPRFTECVAETITRLRTDNDYLNARAAEACLAARWAEDDLVIEARHIADLPQAVAPRAVRRLFALTGDGETNCSAAHLNAVVDLARGGDPSAVVFLPEGRMAQRVYKELLFTMQTSPPSFVPQPLKMEGETCCSHWRFCCHPVVCPDPAYSTPEHFFLSKAKCREELTLRPRQIGDALTLPHRTGAKSVKKLLIDAKVPRRERESIPILWDEDGVIALAGFGPDESRLAVPGEEAWVLTLEKLDP